MTTPLSNTPVSNTFVSQAAGLALEYPLHSLAILAPIGYRIYSALHPQTPLLPLPNSMISIVASYSEFADIESVVSRILPSSNQRLRISYDAMQEQISDGRITSPDWHLMHNLRRKMEPIALPNLLQMDQNYLGIFSDPLPPSLPIQYPNIHSIELQDESGNPLQEVIQEFFPRDTALNALREIVQTCPNLQALDLSQCSRWRGNDYTLWMLANSNLPINSLNLQGRFNVTDTGIQALINSHLPINSLNLLGCDITEAGIQALANSHLPINSLALSSPEGITDASLHALANSNLPINNLALNSNWRRITDAGIQALANSNLPINRLALYGYGCLGITDAAIQALQQAKPGIIITRH